jgi:3-oxoacyl-[acyl-carrier protein] reductase
MIADTDELAAADAAAELEAAVERADVSVEADVVRVFDAAVAEFGRVDLLHANAGLLGDSVSIEALRADAFDRILAVNVRGAFLPLRELLRRRTGPVPPAAVLTASTAAHRAYAGYGAYAVSKHAVLGLVRAAARDHGPDGVRVNAVTPGAMATEMARQAARDISGQDPTDFVTSPGMAEQVAEIPLGRMAAPRDVAAVVAWLLSDEARHVNGASYAVDGGLLA